MKVGMKVRAKPGLLDASLLNAGYRDRVGRVCEVGDELIHVSYDDGKVLIFFPEELRAVHEPAVDRSRDAYREMSSSREPRWEYGPDGGDADSGL